MFFVKKLNSLNRNSETAKELGSRMQKDLSKTKLKTSRPVNLDRRWMDEYCCLSKSRVYDHHFRSGGKKFWLSQGVLNPLWGTNHENHQYLLIVDKFFYSFSNLGPGMIQLKYQRVKQLNVSFLVL